MEMDDVCLLERLKTGDVIAHASRIYGKEATTGKAILYEDFKSFEDKLQTAFPPSFRIDNTLLWHGQTFVTTEHLSVYPLLTQSFEQTASSNGCPTCMVGGID